MTFSYLHPEQVGQTQQQAPQNLTWSIHSFDPAYTLFNQQAQDIYAREPDFIDDLPIPCEIKSLTAKGTHLADRVLDQGAPAADALKALLSMQQSVRDPDRHYHPAGQLRAVPAAECGREIHTRRIGRVQPEVPGNFHHYDTDRKRAQSRFSEKNGRAYR
ncbi:hypothetical protein IFU37_022630 (plasmid) [Pantoea agglomerans]|uniref:hypothetical protein n=1 Tax=Enterobacter agglomerans TaxID=549 RepID=UPI001787063E|nr:hypothetical protein [Pantoea agglomerans]WVL92397.1 hypothetical protein IFU37_022630 [Pantoea agglomerans]